MNSILRQDLHGKTRRQAQVAIDALLRRAGNGVYRIHLVHGCNHGSELRDMIREQYAAHPRVLRLITSQPGVTELVLREF